MAACLAAHVCAFPGHCDIDTGSFPSDVGWSQQCLTFGGGFAVCEAGKAFHRLDCSNAWWQGFTAVDIAAQVILVGRVERDHTLMPTLHNSIGSQRTSSGHEKHALRCKHAYSAGLLAVLGGWKMQQVHWTAFKRPFQDGVGH